MALAMPGLLLMPSPGVPSLLLRVLMPRVAAAADDLALSLGLLHAGVGVLFPVAHIGVTAGPVVNFLVIEGVPGRLRLPGIQQRARLGKVIIVGRVASAGYAFFTEQAIDKIFPVHMRRARTGIIGNTRRPIGQGAERTDIVSEHQIMTAHLVTEVEICPLMLE
jgi:hypothetical protein